MLDKGQQSVKIEGNDLLLHLKMYSKPFPASFFDDRQGFSSCETAKPAHRFNQRPHWDLRKSVMVGNVVYH